jgi:hypothetical protein
VQPAGNHQVQHQPQVAFHTNRDSLTDSPQLAHDSSLHIGNWWLYGSKQEGARQPNAFDWLPNDPWFECTDISGYVWQFRHRYQIPCLASPLQPGQSSRSIFLGMRLWLQCRDTH